MATRGSVALFGCADDGIAPAEAWQVICKDQHLWAIRIVPFGPRQHHWMLLPVLKSSRCMSWKAHRAVWFYRHLPASVHWSKRRVPFRRDSA